MTELTKKRPEFRNINALSDLPTYRLPAAGWVSILHRVSGVLMFLLMPFIIKALLNNRAYYQKKAEEVGEEHLFANNPKARGYLRPTGGYRLFEKREELVQTLTEAVQLNRDWLMEGLTYPLAR